MIFTSNIEKTSNHKQRAETNFEFLNRSSWKISELAREKFNQFCTSYNPDNEFIQMFKSKSSKQHYSAVFELFVYTILTKSNLKLSRHPQTKTGKRPDFLVESKGFKIFLECTLSGHSFEREEKKNRKETVEEIIEKMDCFPYFVNLEFITISTQSISKKKLIYFLNQIKDRIVGLSNQELVFRKYLFDEDGWSIEISLSRKSNQSINRSLGFISEKAKVIDPSQPLLTALNDKRTKRYGIETEPYVICLNTSDLFTGEDDFGKALFGHFSINKFNLIHTNQPGFFVANGNPINTSVSAIIFFRNFDIFTLDNCSISMWHNPFAKNKLPINFMPFNEYIFSICGNGIIQTSKTVKDFDVFKAFEIKEEEYIANKDKSSN